VSPAKLVFEFFKNPRNKRPMENPTAKGVLRGKEPGKEITLFLKVAGGVVLDASYTNTSDRVEDAPLSMLTTLIKGKSVDEARKVDNLVLARALDSEAHPGIAFAACEVLRTTLFALDGKPAPDPGTQVCTCFTVHEERLRRYIRERQLDSVEDVNKWTRACGGCRSCRIDIEKIIQQTLGRPARDA
jgi:NifU-like protein